MGSTEAMEDYEFIDKGELEEASPPKPAEMASSAASSASIFHDRLTHLQNINTEEDDDDTDVEVSSPLASGETRDEHGLQEEEHEADLCILSVHQLAVITNLIGEMVKRSKAGLDAAAKSLKDPQVERHLRAHGASVLAACATLLLSLLLVHRGNQRAISGVPSTSSQVSLAKFGAGCAPLPAAVLGTVRNFTAAQRLLAEGTPSDAGIVLAAYAAHATEQFETAKRAYKKASFLILRILPGMVQQNAHGHRAKATLKAAQKELKQSAKWAGRELHALAKMHRRFVARMQDALHLDREATEQLARQLPELVRSLDGSGARSRAHHRLRLLQRGAARPAADAAAVAAASYETAARGVASAAAILEAHWRQLPPAVQAVAESELAAWTGSWEALAEAICVAELDTRSDAAPVAAAEGCPNRAMSALAARLTASVDFRRRLFHMASTAQLPEETLEHYTVACERGGGMAIMLQRVHAELAGITGDGRAAAAA